MARLGSQSTMSCSLTPPSRTIERTKASVTKGDEFSSMVSWWVMALFKFSFTAIISPLF
jgi:hypothetical protein